MSKFFFLLSSCIQQNICLAARTPHSSDANGRRNVEMGLGGRGGAQDQDGCTNTRVDAQRAQILPGHLLRKSHILRRRTSISSRAWMGFKSLNCCCYN